tara:strand:+ start:3689 stop:4423 length:735 start_codon:yes stop_codon:yes gene_type:complete
MESNPSRQYVVFYDLETQQLLNEVHGRFRDDKVKNLEISCGCAIAIPLEFCRDPNDRNRAFEERIEYTVWHASTKPCSRIEDLLLLFDNAFLIVAYNQFGFDSLVLKQYYRDEERFEMHMQKQLDVFVGVRAAMLGEKWPSLNWLLGQNGLDSKEADGLDAVKWWKSGSTEDLQKLANYCLADVRLLCKLALLQELNIGRPRPLANYCFGIASAVAAREKSLSLEPEDERQERQALQLYLWSEP